MDLCTIIHWIGALITTILCGIASVFAIVGTIGIFRFPDAYTRLQASGLIGTTATFSVLLAALITAPSAGIAFRVIIIIMFFLISNPTTTHIIARYAWKSGIEPWTSRKRGRPGRASRNNDVPGANNTALDGNEKSP